MFNMLNAFTIFTVPHQNHFFEFHTRRTKIYFSIFAFIELTRIYAFWYVYWNMLLMNVQDVYIHDGRLAGRYRYICVMVCAADLGIPHRPTRIHT